MYVSAVLSWAIFGYTPTWTGWFLRISWDFSSDPAPWADHKMTKSDPNFLVKNYRCPVLKVLDSLDCLDCLTIGCCFNPVDVYRSFPMGKTVARRNFLSGMALVTVAMVRGLDRCLNGLVVKKPWEVTKIWGFHDGKWWFLHWKWWFMYEKLGKWSIEDGDLTLKVEI